MNKPSEELLELAREAATRAYCPYSSFRVGAAVLAGDQIYTGCNIENASYGLTLCAERTAIFKAISEGHRAIQAVAVSCPDVARDAPPELRMPCGPCRQVMAEFADSTLPVIVDEVGEFKLADLLPRPFILEKP